MWVKSYVQAPFLTLACESQGLRPGHAYVLNVPQSRGYTDIWDKKLGSGEGLGGQRGRDVEGIFLACP